MSTRVPPTVRRLIDLYNVISRKQNSVYAEEIESFLRNTSDSSLRDKRWSILNKNARKGLDWKIDRNRERRLFQDPIQFGPNELKETKYLFKDQTKFRKTEGVLPGSFIAKKNNVYNAAIESTVKAYFNPVMSLSVHKQHQNILRFYLQRLANAPIMIIFKQKCDLFSPTSMDQWNQPFFDMRKRTRLENGKYSGQVMPPYELTKVIHPDLLSLALKSESFMRTNGQSFSQLVKSAPWSDVELIEDKLANILYQEQSVRTLNKADLSEPKDDEVVDFSVTEAMQMVENGTPTATVVDDFPYTLTYNRFYLLNLLNLDADLSSFESLWNNTDFEIVGARLTLHDPRVKSLLQTFATAADLQHASRYEDILKLAKSEEANTDGLNGVIHTIASKGLINTSFNNETGAVYLTKSS
ncbi:hypothetical protein I9W82_004252 [Candida metapsilosis]|uniref:Uncharacterized protein n=1 Tax=Candida metapsilosis TaxID=273372 RepID=A0A8H7ZCD3_9ASCO|nr:hypothetical protein I9W82_004252 [Candida metapsilosis]